MRKMSTLIVLLSIILLLAACGGGGGNTTTDGEVYKIGISQYLEHPSLDATREGFLAALKEAGIEKGVNLELDYNTAQADSTNNLSIAQKLAGGNYDLVVAIATPSAVPLAQAMEKAAKDTPMLFAAVSDPLNEKLVESLDKPGGKITGAADLNPKSIEMLMDFIAEHLPDVKNVGLVINKGEPNAVIMANLAQEALAKHGVNLIEAPVTNTSEVQQAAQSLVGRVDALFVTLDNSVVSAVNAIIQIAEENEIPLFASDRDTVQGGAVAAYGFDYYDHGYQAGEIAVEILKQGKKPADLAVTIPDTEKLDLILNVPAAERQGVEVTEAMLNEVKHPEENLIQD